VIQLINLIKGYVMLTQWLPKDEENKIPDYAFCYISSCGAVVDKENQKILLIQEKYEVKNGLWKLPGGKLSILFKISRNDGSWRIHWKSS
jgi:hypothetical protein